MDVLKINDDDDDDDVCAYTVDIHVEMYAVKDIEYKYMNLNLNEHQDGH